MTKLKGIILFLFSLVTLSMSSQCDLELYNFNPETLDATIIVHNGYGCNQNDLTDDVIEKFILSVSTPDPSDDGELGCQGPNSNGALLQNYVINYPLTDIDVGPDNLLRTGDTITFDIFDAIVDGAITEPCWQEAYSNGYFDKCMEISIYQINCSNDINGYTNGEDNCVDNITGNGYLYPDVTPENNSILVGPCANNECELGIYGFDPNTGDISIIVNNGENCGCNENTQVDGNTCGSSNSSTVNNNAGVSNLVIGIHKVGSTENYECTNASNYPGWTWVFYQNTSIPTASNPGAISGEFINFNLFDDALGNTACFEQLLPYAPEGECYELVIWQINLSQTANTIDFQGDPYAWVNINPNNDTHMYPDFQLWNNTITWCNEDPDPPLIEGCTDPDADNYDDTATYDDGSCTYTIPGCPDPSACNYNSNANQNDGSCAYCDPLICSASYINAFCGCTDPDADNYNSTAIHDDGSCEYTNTGSPDARPSITPHSVECVDGEAISRFRLTIWNDGNDTLFRYCVEIPELGFDQCLDGYESSQEWISPGEGQFVSWIDIPLDGSITELNINVYFAEDELLEDEWNNSIVYTINPDSFEDPCEYPDAVPDTSIFSFECIDGTPEVVMDIFIKNEGDLELVNYCVEIPEIGFNMCFDGQINPNFIVQPGGQIDITEYIPSISFDLDFITINISNVDPEESNIFNNSLQVDFSHSSDDDPCIILGCIDPTANNYNPDANTDDGSCEYDVLGCTDPTANNYNPAATVDDGSCTYDIFGCTDPEANNYDPDATIDNGSCDYDVFGCTDSSAINYNPLATIDDDSCEYNVFGCTDPDATNYNEFATVDDGSCTYIVDPCDSEEVLIPNAFTPNNDGINDEWYPVTNPDCWKYWNIKIFNRWGQMIWQTEDKQERWDGSVMDNGNCVSDGVYVYIVLGESYNADIFQKTGHITVIK